MRNRPRTLIAAALATVSLSHAVFAQSEPSVDEVVATVNGTDITLGHVLALRTELPADYSMLPANVLLSVVIDQLIQQTLLMEEAQPTLSKQAQILVENETRAIMAGEALRKVMNAELDEQAIQAAYAARYETEIARKEFHASHILVETEEQAIALRAELEGDTDFAEMAREHSTGPSGPAGGELGWFAEGRMVPEFFEAVVPLEPGQISQPVQTTFGWHLIRLNDTRTRDVPALEAVRSEIVDELRQERLKAHLANLENGAEVERLDTSHIDPEIVNQPELLED